MKKRNLRLQFFILLSLSTPAFADNNVCAGANVAGLDVSDNQPQIAWNQVASSGRSFSFVKATEGETFKSARFDVDWAAASAAGVYRGAYHLFLPADDPAQQADFFLSTVGSGEDGDLPPMFDWEETQNVSPDVIVQGALVWLQRVEAATGKIPIIYTFPAYWHSLGDPPEFARYPLFIADYTGSCPDVPSPWKAWTFWQQRIGTSPGVSGAVDLDVFNGFLRDLTALLQG
jgi:lysozyme